MDLNQIHGEAWPHPPPVCKQWPYPAEVRDVEAIRSCCAKAKATPKGLLGGSLVENKPRFDHGAHYATAEIEHDMLSLQNYEQTKKATGGQASLLLGQARSHLILRRPSHFQVRSD